MTHYKELNQSEIDRAWAEQKRAYLANGFTEVEFLLAQLGMAKFGEPLATEIQQAKTKALRTFQ